MNPLYAIIRPVMMLILLMITILATAQNVAINTDGSLPNSNAILDLKSKDKGLLIPRMDSNTRKSIDNTIGLLVYDSTYHSFWYNNGTNWVNISTGSGWSLAGNSGIGSSQFLGTVDNVPLMIKVNNVKSGFITSEFASGNTYWGYAAGFYNTTGAGNSATGYYALLNNKTGNYNTATGNRALVLNTSGIENTATGASALFNDTSGSYNSAHGAGALVANTNGNYNVANGWHSLYGNTTGNYNTATGAMALSTATTPDFNTANGFQALYLTTTGRENTAVGAKTLYSNTTGFFNTGLGAGALFKNDTGAYNTAAGYESLLNNTLGSRNTSSGFHAMLTNSTGIENTATGTESLYSNTNGYFNAATGSQSLYSNTSGRGNVANGYKTLRSNTAGAFNVANGYLTMYANTTGSFNIASGDNTMQSNTTGDNNAAFGGASLYSNTTGINNTAIGDFAMSHNVTGNLNTAIGSNADVNEVNLSNATAIGCNTIVDASNKVRIGNAAVTVIEGQVPFTTPSDGRFKYNIEENVKGLDFILKLRPVTYQFDVQQFDASFRKNEITRAQSARAAQNGLAISDDKQADNKANKLLQASYNEASKIRRTGFVAQEVEKAAIASGYNFSGIIKPKTDKEHYSLSYESFVVPLVKAVQEQEQTIEAQNKKISELQQQVIELIQFVQSQKGKK